MTEQQKKEIEKIWNSKIELRPNMICIVEECHNVLSSFWNHIYLYSEDKRFFVSNAHGSVLIDMETNSKIQQTLKVLGWIE